MVTIALRLAAVAIGPFSLWGPTVACFASAMKAFSHSAQIPPIWHTSGWTMAAARAARKSLKLYLVTRRSPAAIVTGDLDLTSAIALMLSSRMGSSNHIGE